ncbi:hypothetical protein DSCO28_33310 [Desulfosarcina ovata subsp. sediminis]|uniref:Sulfotransferase domain-containing protein n=2 Tax=Desulfosarcina ovata TaxID=83564 RepID=A0A5K7ZPG5_9BACT|nr:hypothetical protein DSCO28_33310 [Desulfosarcina ovata subsp. sediminis]
MIFSLANSYSGHTLLSLFLNNQPQITHLGDTILEKSKKGRAYCSCGKLTIDDPFWEKVYNYTNYNEIENSIFDKSLMYRIIYFYPNLKYIQQPFSINKKLIRFKNVFGQFYDYMQKLFQPSVFIYGKIRIEAINFLSLQNIPIKIIHLSKSPIEFVASMKNRRQKRGTKVGYSNISEFSKVWLRYNERILKIKEKSKKCSVLHLDYSDFCKETEYSVKKICDFINVQFDNRFLDPFPSQQHLIGADSVILRFKRIEKDRSRSDILTDKEKMIVNKITSICSKKLGYVFD